VDSDDVETRYSLRPMT